MRKPCSPERFNVLGVGVHALNISSALELIFSAIREKRKGYVCFTGVHGVSEAQKDPRFRGVLNSAFLNTPDGIPMTWMGRLQGRREVSRVYGPDMLLEICRQSPEKGIRHFLYGGGQGVAETLKRRLEERFPGLQIAGTYTPPFRPLNRREEKELIGRVALLKPDIFWVGLGTPKQEYFLDAWWRKLDATLMMSVGAAFDFHSGMKRQAPRWMQRSGLEWVFRLFQEPGRLWKRYAVNNPLFLIRSFLQLTGLKNYPIAPETRDPASTEEA